ncbi:phage portal protein [bacterium]|nr:phage portal protein [bacterium]
MFNWFRRNKTETYSDLSILRDHYSTAGVVVNEKTALNLVSVFACVRAISETLASLPFPVYRRLNTGGKERLRDHPVYKALNISPDGILPAMQWRESGLGHLLTWGNWYNEIEMTHGGELVALHLLLPNKVQPQRTKSGKVEYKVEGSYVPIPAERMCHVAGLGFDGLSGYSPIKLGKSAISLSLAAETFGSSWFGNGSRGQGVITHPQRLSDSAKANLRESLSEVHGGPENAHRWMIFEEGISVQQLGVPPEDAQFLGTRLFQLQEICRLYRISPALVGDLSRSTFSNQEQEGINFVVHTLRPHCRRIENEFCRKLFQLDDDLFAEHLLDGLLRGDSATRNAAYATGRQWGWYSADDINELENRNPLPEGQGQIYLVPANMVNAADYLKPAEEPATETPPEPAEEPPTAVPEPNQEALAASLNCVQDNIDRMLRREVEAIRNAARKPMQFLHLVDLFYETHRPMVERALSPSVKAYGLLAGKFDQLVEVPDLLDGRDELLELSGSVSATELPQAVEQWANRRLGKGLEITRQLAT